MSQKRTYEASRSRVARLPRRVLENSMPLNPMFGRKNPPSAVASFSENVIIG
ncbi:hypothetical protein DXG03_007956, partial [Asterophora parasitica]